MFPSIFRTLVVTLLYLVCDVARCPAADADISKQPFKARIVIAFRGAGEADMEKLYGKDYDRKAIPIDQFGAGLLVDLEKFVPLKSDIPTYTFVFSSDTALNARLRQRVGPRFHLMPASRPAFERFTSPLASSPESIGALLSVLATEWGAKSAADASQWLKIEIHVSSHPGFMGAEPGLLVWPEDKQTGTEDDWYKAPVKQRVLIKSDFDNLYASLPKATYQLFLSTCRAAEVGNNLLRSHLWSIRCCNRIEHVDFIGWQDAFFMVIILSCREK